MGKINDEESNPTWIRTQLRVVETLAHSCDYFLSKGTLGHTLQTHLKSNSCCQHIVELNDRSREAMFR